MSDKTINRDVTHHGPRLQRLRALVKLFQLHKKNKGTIHFYFGIEFGGDVIVKQEHGKNVVTHHEEDKNYDSESTFSMNSPEIRKALVGIIDTWFSKNLSDNCFFAFYSTNKVTKERKTSLINKLKIELPCEPLLELLDQRELDDKIIEVLSKLIIGFYKEEYRKEKGQGYLKEVQNFTVEYWKNLFGRIHFSFGQPDHKELKKDALLLIQECEFYNSTHLGKEQHILSLVLEMLDERHISDDPTENLIHIAELENIFLRVAEDKEGKQIDMIYKQWDQVDADISDIRNIREKMSSASKSVSEERILISTRRASTGLAEKEDYDHIKDFQSMRYRIYELCIDLMRIYEKENDITALNDEEYDKLHNYLLEECKKEIVELSNDFNYSFKSKRVIDGIIFELIDSCFLSYDKFKEQ